MLLRPIDPSEVEAVADVHRRAFGSDVEADLARALMLDDGFVRTLSFVAEDGGRLLGHVLFSRSWLERDDGEPGFPLLVLAPLAVVPESQHEGVGTTLVEAAIALARESGEIGMLVFGDPAYYGRFGFTDAWAKGIRTPHPTEPTWGWQALELAECVLGPSGILRVAPPLDAPEMWIA
ncbi:MAG: N-acetyltransferase [Coriobacteriia bacterium]|nr:N-acetyltransferase [Coriobacteriia bacterium]